MEKPARGESRECDDMVLMVEYLRDTDLTTALHYSCRPKPEGGYGALRQELLKCAISHDVVYKAKGGGIESARVVDVWFDDRGSCSTIYFSFYGRDEIRGVSARDIEYIGDNSDPSIQRIRAVLEKHAPEALSVVDECIEVSLSGGVAGDFDEDDKEIRFNAVRFLNELRERRGELVIGSEVKWSQGLTAHMLGCYIERTCEGYDVHISTPRQKEECYTISGVISERCDDLGQYRLYLVVIGTDDVPTRIPLDDCLSIERGLVDEARFTPKEIRRR